MVQPQTLAGENRGTGLRPGSYREKVVQRLQLRRTEAQGKARFIQGKGGSTSDLSCRKQIHSVRPGSYREKTA